MLELDRIPPLRPESIRQLGDSDGSRASSRSLTRVSASPSLGTARTPQDARSVPATLAGRETASTDFSPDALQDAVQSRLNEILEEVVEEGHPERAIRVSRDEESGRFVYKAVDIASGEVIRQFPPEEILRLVRAVREAAGLVLDENA